MVNTQRECLKVMTDPFLCVLELVKSNYLCGSRSPSKKPSRTGMRKASALTLP